MPRTLVTCCLAIASACFVPLACADTLETFDVNGAFQLYLPYPCTANCQRPTGSITGTETINTTVGLVTNANITVNLFGITDTFSGPPANQGPNYNSGPVNALGPDATAYDVNLVSGSATLDLSINISELFGPNYLVGYTGGQLCGLTDGACGDDGYVFPGYFNPGNPAYSDDVLQGTLTPSGSITATPEPNSIALLGTGLLGVAGVVRRRAAPRT